MTSFFNVEYIQLFLTESFPLAGVHTYNGSGTSNYRDTGASAPYIDEVSTSNYCTFKTELQKNEQNEAKTDPYKRQPAYNPWYKMRIKSSTNSTTIVDKRNRQTMQTDENNQPSAAANQSNNRILRRKFLNELNESPTMQLE